VLPLLRRTFGEFAAPERASIGRAVQRLPGGLGGGGGRVADEDREAGFDPARAAAALCTVDLILGGPREVAR
jgi:hypothetical protein